MPRVAAQVQDVARCILHSLKTFSYQQNETTFTRICASPERHIHKDFAPIGQYFNRISELACPKIA